MRDTLKGRALRCGLSIWCSGCRVLVDQTERGENRRKEAEAAAIHVRHKVGKSKHSGRGTSIAIPAQYSSHLKMQARLYTDGDRYQTISSFLPSPFIH